MLEPGKSTVSAYPPHGVDPVRYVPINKREYDDITQLSLGARNEFLVLADWGTAHVITLNYRTGKIVNYLNGGEAAALSPASLP